MKSYVHSNWPRLLAVVIIALVLGLGGFAPDPMLLGAAAAAPFLVGDTLNAEQVKELFEKQGKAWTEFKTTNDALVKAKADGKAVADLEAKVAKIGEDLDKLADLKSEVDAAIAAMQRPTGAEGDAKSKLEAECKAFNLNLAAHRQGKGAPIGNMFDVDGYTQYKGAFLKMVRTGNLESLNADERKAMIAGSDPDGGFLLPTPTMGRMVTKLFEQSIMRQIADVQSISGPALEGIIDNNEADAGWVSEVGARTETNTPQIGKYRIEAFEMYAAPKASQQLLDDAVVDIEGWLAGKVADKFGRVEGAAFWTGTGVGQARGITTYPLAVTGDATRAWGTFEKVKTGANGDFHTTQFDPVHTLMGAFKEHFLNNAQFVMRRAVRTKARLLKESTTNRYLWEPGMQVGAPEKLMGYPVRVDEYMPALATGSASLAFGDFKQAYTIVDRIGVRVLRDPFTSKPYVIFYSTKRTGGGAVNFEAVKFLTFEA